MRIDWELAVPAAMMFGLWSATMFSTEPAAPGVAFAAGLVFILCVFGAIRDGETGKGGHNDKQEAGV